MRSIYPAKDLRAKILTCNQPLLINQDVEISLETLDELLQCLVRLGFVGTVANEDPGFRKGAFRQYKLAPNCARTGTIVVN